MYGYINEHYSRRYPPDLVFKYSLNNPLTTANKIINGNDILQTTNGIITSQDGLEIIGKFAFNIVIYNGTDENNKLYEITGTNVYFLPEGTISNSINLNIIKDSNGKFIVPPNQSNVFQILSGSGDFLNSTGFIVQITKENSDREIQVYFNK